MKSVRLINLPKIPDSRGNLTFIEFDKHIPFSAERIFYIYDVPSGQNRGAHSHIKCHQFLISISGSFFVELDDGINKQRVFLNRPDVGLYIPPGIWASEVDFSTGSVCLVLASHQFDEKDYIRDYNLFLKSKV